jgi:hypothetical protein
MAAESERQPDSNGGVGRSRGVEDDEPASTAPRRSGSEDDVTELSQSDAVKPSSQTPPVPEHPSDSTAVSGPISTPSSASPETSPTRPTPRASSSNSTTRIPSLSRKGSESRSPARSNSGQSGQSALPSAPAVQRAAQNDKPPALIPPSNSECTDVPSPDKTNMPPWATSRRPDQDSAIPNTSSKRSSVPTDDNAKGDRSAPRNVSRGLNGSAPALETVQETSSDLSTPSTDTTVHQPLPEEPRLPKIDEDATPKAPGPTVESGSDSGGNKSSGAVDDTKAQASSGQKARAVIPKRSTTSLTGSRGKATDGSVRNMTVETETVSTIPQVSVGVASVDRGNAGRSDQGTVRVKPSTETIRPKKEKRKTRRPAALTSGTASSKADIFEAKVASAVDEADVSDSDETFVYESNPPDPYQGRPPPRYHSRTPSATSMASQADQFASRTRPGLRDGGHSITGKRSMKFTNNTYNNGVDGEAGDDGGRHSRADSGTLTPRHHHIGRYGRNNMYPSLFDNDSPFPQSQPTLKSPKHYLGSGFRHPRNTAQRAVPNYRTINNPKKMGDAYGFDYDAEGADDERTPLVGSPRYTRGRHGRRPNSASLRQMEYMQRRQRGYFSRYGTSGLVGLLVLLVIGGATAFVIAVTKPLVDVKVIAIQNVLASEQEIMLDLDVQAVNPNLFPVAVDDMDVNIFARSRFVGTDSLWRDDDSEVDHLPRVENSRKRARLGQVVRCLGSMSCLADTVSSSPVRGNDGVDRGTDPIDSDPAGDAQTMLLGRVYRFDSPLAFEPSPWNHHSSQSKGQIRLARPGNKTEEGGTERWERVLQHKFELIVRGVIKYQLSLSSRFYSASVSSSTRVVPQDDGDDNDGDGDGHGHKPKKNDTVRLSRRKPPLPRLAITEAGASEAARRSSRCFTG